MSKSIEYGAKLADKSRNDDRTHHPTYHILDPNGWPWCSCVTPNTGTLNGWDIRKQEDLPTSDPLFDICRKCLRTRTKFKGIPLEREKRI